MPLTFPKVPYSKTKDTIDLVNTKKKENSYSIYHTISTHVAGNLSYNDHEIDIKHKCECFIWLIHELRLKLISQPKIGKLSLKEGPSSDAD